MITEWTTKARAATRKLKSYEARVAEAERVASSPNFQQYKHVLNELTYKFIMCQIKNQKLPPRGRRFTLEEKILAMTLMKSSGKGYRLLSQIFALPSRQTISNLLNNIPLRPGINKHIFQALKDAVSKMQEKDRHCILIFDEVAIEPTIQYNKKYDCIEGVEDNGSKRCNKLADHANVFMVKGALRNWVQPLLFSFSSGPIKSDPLATTIKEVVRECRKIGLTIIASVCDQGSANVAAVNKLLRETNTSCLQKGEENRYGGYVIDNQEIIPLYDMPHLFKGLRNNLLNKDLHFVINGKQMVAKWKHVIQFYLLDLSDDTRICPKLTDNHVIPERLNKMKVSFCTQVFSHTVGSLMKRIAKWSEYSIQLTIQSKINNPDN